jgi:OOP family OmpA-OmpF porin
MASDYDGGERWRSSRSATSTTTTRRVQAYRKRRLWPLLFAPGVLIAGIAETNSRIEDDLEGKARRMLGDRFVSADFSAQDTVLCVNGDFDEAYRIVKEATGVERVVRDASCTTDGAAPTTSPATEPLSTPAPTQPVETTAAPTTDVPTTITPTTIKPITTTSPTTVAASALSVVGTFDGTVITLNGVVDSPAQRTAIVDGALAAVGGDSTRVVDQLTVADSPSGSAVAAADGEAEALAALFPTLPANFASGSAGVDGTLFLRGVYLDEAAKTSAEADAAAAGVDPAEIDIEPRPVATEEDRERLIAAINALVAEATIQFQPGSAELLAESNVVLDRVAAELKQFDLAGISITIEGHTDGDGSAASNQSLSQLRAEAVEAALVERGISGDALQPVGFGETQPIAANDTPENKAKNRRVQFSAQQ